MRTDIFQIWKAYQLHQIVHRVGDLEVKKEGKERIWLSSLAVFIFWREGLLRQRIFLRAPQL